MPLPILPIELFDPNTGKPVPWWQKVIFWTFVLMIFCVIVSALMKGPASGNNPIEEKPRSEQPLENSSSSPLDDIGWVTIKYPPQPFWGLKCVYQVYWATEEWPEYWFPAYVFDNPCGVFHVDLWKPGDKIYVKGMEGQNTFHVVKWEPDPSSFL